MVRTVKEVQDGGSVPLFRHPEWQERWSWIYQGTTGRGDEPEEFDLGAFGQSPIGPTLDRWRRIREETGTRTAVHARQVHGVGVGEWDDPLPAGLFLVEGLDAHVTEQPGVLLAISVADCVPIFLVSEQPRAIAMVHAGWRGVAGGALESAVGALLRRSASTGSLWVHCGPSICGRCYEVGPEVHQAVNPQLPVPDRASPIDLRQALAGRAQDLGVHPERITLSEHCTLCGPGQFFSHRGGSPARQMGVLGLLE